MVKPTRIGNFLVKWKTNYPDDVPFSKDLIAELSYRKKGETDEVKEGDMINPSYYIIPLFAITSQRQLSL